MPAVWILRFARTRRCDIVCSLTRNARAISAVLRPASVRRVSATRASSGRPGWQQVKISRSRSSYTPLVSTSSSGASYASAVTTSRSLAAPTAARRILSVARLRAVVVSQAPGLRGTPSVRQLCRAAANASCAASSARSQSPVTRINVATTWPHSVRNAATTAASAGCDIQELPNLDRAFGGPRVAGGHLERLVRTAALDQDVAADLLLGLRERTVGAQDLAVTHPDRGRAPRRVQPLGAEQHAARGHLGRPLGAPGHQLGLRTGRLVPAEHQHVPHRHLRRHTTARRRPRPRASRGTPPRPHPRRLGTAIDP